MSIFIVDTNFFIEAHRATYPLDVAEGFWKKVKELADAQKIISIDKVKNEIFKNEDDLKKWCAVNLSDDFFKDSKNALAQYGAVSNWAGSMIGQYAGNAIAEFLHADEADAFLISYALVDQKERIIVTHEKSKPNSRSKIKIPEPCNHFGIEYCSTIEMFRKLNEKF